MFLHIGNDFSVKEQDVVLVLDSDTATKSAATRDFLKKKQAAGLVIDASDDLPRSLIVAGKAGKDSVLYLSRLSAKTIKERAEEKRKERHW